MCKVFRVLECISRLLWHPHEGKPGTVFSPTVVLSLYVVGFRAALGRRSEADKVSFVLLAIKSANWPWSLEILCSGLCKPSRNAVNKLFVQVLIAVCCPCRKAFSPFLPEQGAHTL